MSLALLRSEFVVWYQPVVDVRSGNIVGAEALVRWNHPTAGLIAPGTFIESAEQTGVIIPLGAYVLETACSQLAIWRTTVLADVASFKLAVNISAVQLSTPDLVDQLERLLTETGIPAEWLYLEITETAAIADIDHIVGKVEQIQSLGVRIAIDDFGTGHNSLKHLHRLPVDVVKIDQSFVAALGPGDNSRGMVAAVLALARTLGMRTVAEGVETPVQAARLRKLGGDLAQGYLYGRAQPAVGADAAARCGQPANPSSPPASVPALSPGSRRLPPSVTVPITRVRSAWGASMDVSLRRTGVIVATIGILLATFGAVPAGADSDPSATGGDRARYILPPGNYGGLPTTAQSRDQLPLYDGLTPLRGNVTDADIDSHFIPEDFKPVGATHEEPTGRPGTTIVYDSYGVPHVSGKTRADLAFGAGWVTARDRGLLLQLGRGPARAVVADVPGINAFGLVTSGQTFVPSAQTEQLVTDQANLIVQTYGDKGREMIADMQAEADGITAYFKANNIDQPPATVNDVIAVTAFIGSIFGAGGGAEASNAEFLAKLQGQLGADTGRQAWEDAMLFGDPEAPTTITQPFNYGIDTGGPVTGSKVIDAGSIVSLDPTQTPAAAGGRSRRRADGEAHGRVVAGAR